MRTIQAAVASALLAFLAGCSATTTPAMPTASSPQNQPPDFGNPPYSRGPSEPFSFKHPTFEAQAVPAIWITPDVDGDQNPTLNSDFDTGHGFMARAGLGSTQQNIGLMYMETWQDELTTDSGTRTEALYLDFLYRAPIPDLAGAVWFAAAGGVGLAEIQFNSDQFDDQTTGAAQLRGELEFKILDPLTLSAGLGGFIFGDPGDTIAYGTFVTLGVKLLF